MLLVYHISTIVMKYGAKHIKSMLILKLYILQKHAIRLVTNSDFRSPTCSLPHFVKLKILPLFELVKLNVSIFYVQIPWDSPAVFNYMFKTNFSFHNYHTRTRNNLCVPTTRSTIRTHSIRFTGVHEWNSICQDFKSSSTLSCFRTLFKRSMFEKMSCIHD